MPVARTLVDLALAGTGATAAVYGVSLIYVPAAWIVAGLMLLWLVAPVRLSSGGRP